MIESKARIVIPTPQNEILFSNARIKKLKPIHQLSAELEEIELTKKNSKELCQDIQKNMIEFKRGFKKAPLTMKRRLLHKVLGKLVFTHKGLEVEFRFNQARENRIQEPFESANGKIIDFRAKKIPRTDLIGSEESLSLPFEKLRIEGIGWGGRT